MQKKSPKVKKATLKVLDEQDRVIETDEVGIPTLFQPGEWDQQEELENNEALREHLRDQIEQF